LRKELEVIMDNIMSTRMDEAVSQHIGLLAKTKLGASKKTILENTVRQYAEKIAAILAAIAIQFNAKIYTLNTKHYPMPEVAVKRAWATTNLS
jgi:hypothetical protein